MQFALDYLSAIYLGIEISLCSVCHERCPNAPNGLGSNWQFKSPTKGLVWFGLIIFQAYIEKPQIPTNPTITDSPTHHIWLLLTIASYQVSYILKSTLETGSYKGSKTIDPMDQRLRNTKNIYLYYYLRGFLCLDSSFFSSKMLLHLYV